MSSDFDKATKFTLGIEGGHSNDPRDNGGETMWGITEAVARADGYTGDMRLLPVERALSIYKRKYWDTIKGDQLPYPLNAFLFDYSVNSGFVRAAKALQKAVGTLPDGKIGPKTLAAVSGKSQLHIMRLVFVDRVKLMAEHSDYEHFKNGWFARMFDVTVDGVRSLYEQTTIN